MGFKVGDKVKIQIDSEDRHLEDLQTDLLCDISEGDISGTTYDKICGILTDVASGNSPIFTVSEVDKSRGIPQYGLKRNKTSMRYLWEERYLIPA